LEPGAPWRAQDLEGPNGDSWPQITEDGKFAAIAVFRQPITLWTINEPVPRAISLGKRSYYWGSMAVSPDSRWLAAGADHDILVWDLHDHSAPPMQLSGHQETANVVGFSSDSRWLISKGGDSTIRRWDMNLESLLRDAEQLVGRDLTDDERAIYLPQNGVP
jgi:WD40 repeat protein